MKKYYSIAIPKPCHEDWNTMSQREKGKFCSSCSKTVIDFTKMDTNDIQEFIHENKQNNICGHFKQTQLDSINLHIPSQILEQQHNFHKVFLLALLITMGTSLMNCTNKQGDQQKIDSVEIVDTLNHNKVINISSGLPRIEKIDSIPERACSSSKDKSEKNIIEEIHTEGEMIIETVGDIIITEPKINLDSLDTMRPPWCPAPENGKKEVPLVVGFISVEAPPEFKNTPKHFNRTEKRAYLSKRISELVTKNFNTNVCSNLKGRQLVNTQFKIDKEGKVIDIKVRAPHSLLEKEAKRVLELLPQFSPAKQDGKPVIMVYTLPIIFQAEE